jgi:hypothetical protein
VEAHRQTAVAAELPYNLVNLAQASSRERQLADALR